MLQIQPDAIQSEQTDEFIDGGINEMAAGYKRRLTAAEFRFDTTKTHEQFLYGERGRIIVEAQVTQVMSA